MRTEDLGKIMGNRILESYFDYANVSNLVYEALDFGFESIQVFPNLLPKVEEVLNGREMDVCAVIAYPHGTFLPEQKAFEIKDALEAGATQVEFVVNNVDVRSGKWNLVRADFSACRKAAGDHVLKVIFECEWLTGDMIDQLCKIAIEEKIDRICTSIGVYTRPDKNKNDLLIGTKVEDVKRIKAVVGNQVKVVAQGGIKSVDACEKMLEAGADYISSEFAADIIRKCG